MAVFVCLFEIFIPLVTHSIVMVMVELIINSFMWNVSFVVLYSGPTSPAFLPRFPSFYFVGDLVFGFCNEKINKNGKEQQ